LNRILGYENRVGMSNRPPHSPTLADGEDIYRFFDVFLKHKRADRVKPSDRLCTDAELTSRVLAVIPDERMRKYVDRNKDFTDYDLLIDFELLPWNGLKPRSGEGHGPIDLALYYRAASPENGLRMAFDASGLPGSTEPLWRLMKIKNSRAEPMVDPTRREPAVRQSPLETGERYRLRFKLTWNHTAVKVWPSGEPEPLAWPLIASDLEFTGGSLMLEYYPGRIRYDLIEMNGCIVPLESISPYMKE
jgi:hypothetical protein